MSSPFLQIEEYLIRRFADLQTEVDTLKSQVKVLAALGPLVQPDVTVTNAVPPVEALPATEPKTRKSRAKPPVTTVPAALLSDDEAQVAASAPEPAPAPVVPAAITRIVTTGELIAAVQLYRGHRGIESARAMWARVAPGKNKISDVTDAERPTILDLVNAELAHAAN